MAIARHDLHAFWHLLTQRPDGSRRPPCAQRYRDWSPRWKAPRPGMAHAPRWERERLDLIGPVTRTTPARTSRIPRPWMPPCSAGSSGPREGPTGTPPWLLAVGTGMRRGEMARPRPRLHRGPRPAHCAANPPAPGVLRAQDPPVPPGRSPSPVHPPLPGAPAGLPGGPPRGPGGRRGPSTIWWWTRGTAPRSIPGRFPRGGHGSVLS